MDYKRFLSLLPDLYDNWGQNSVRPKSNQFQQILEQVGGMTTANVMQLLNFAVDCMEPDEIYCEIGCFNGANLIGALLEHPSQMGYAVDNFSEFDPAGESFNKLIDNLSTFSLEEQVFVCNQDWEEFLFDLRTIEAENKLSVYFYNGTCDYRSQMLGLLLVRPFLADKALIVVGNSNGSAVKQANWDFIAAYPQCQLLLNLSTPEDRHCTFWNGIQVLEWDSEQDYNYESKTIKQQQNKSFIQAIYNWQIEFDSQKKAIDELLREAIELENGGCYEQAENKYNEILKLDKNKPEVLFHFGMLHYKTNRYQQALDLLIKSSQIDPSKALQHFCLGLVFEKINNIPQAIQSYEQAIKLEPHWNPPYINLGNTLFNVGEPEKAKSFYQKLVDTEPNNFIGYLSLGNVFVKQHQLDEAITNYEKALTLQPSDRECLNNLVYALHNSGRTQSAIELANKSSHLLLDNLTLKLKSYLLLPIIYELEAEIDFYRVRFAQGLKELIQQTSLDTPEARKSALAAIGDYTNFYLQYQGKMT